jgi:hypothetical protein
MKNDLPSHSDPSARTVFTAHTASVPKSADERHRVPSFIPDSLGNGGRHLQPHPMRLTDRDCDIIDLVFHARALMRDQIEIALFPPSATTRSQTRLTALVRNHYLDTLPRRFVTDPAVYLLSRRSVAGNRLVRARWGEAEFRRRMTRLGSLGHLLGVNDIRVRVERACRDLGWRVALWQQPADLIAALNSRDLIPDSYFVIHRTVEGTDRTAAFFLELERAHKSSRVLHRKLIAYGDLYYSGRFQQIFGTRALRVLFVFAAETGGHPDRRITTAVNAARRSGVTLARFAELRTLSDLVPSDVLTANVWAAPSTESRLALFSPLAKTGSPRT